MKHYDDNGKQVFLDPTQTLGDGGEAYVYRFGALAAKVYRRPEDPFYSGAEPAQKHQRESAKRRLSILQTKLRAFPKGLPMQVVTPQGFLYADPHKQEISGYVMPLVAGAVKAKDLAKVQNRPVGFDNNGVLKFYAGVAETVELLHASSVVIGDFNANNLLAIMASQEPRFIDADSMQWGQYFCETFLVDYVDPLVCDSTANTIRQCKPHTVASDNYALATMLFETLTYLHPYLGVYEPADKSKRVPREMRPLSRITWFNPRFPGVKLPKFALPIGRLSDDWMHYFDGVFHQDKREPVSLRLLKTTKWLKCAQCGAEHCRSRCPECQHAAPPAPSAIKETVRGKVRVVNIFNTGGMLLAARYQAGKLLYLHNTNNQFVREDSRVISQGVPQPSMRFELSGDRTLFGANNTMIVFDKTQPQPRQRTVEMFRNERPNFVANGEHYYWANDGLLFRDEGLGELGLGQVLTNQTRLWVGDDFGVGFYQAGGIQRTLIFDAKNRGVNDRVELPLLRGQILEARCYFSRSRAWLFFSLQEGSKIMNRCFVIERSGVVAASAEAEAGDDSWLGSIGGKAPADLPSPNGTVHALFAARDSGLVRAQVEGREIFEKAAFPDTDGFVDSSHELLMGRDGIYVVSRHDIRLLQLRQ